MNIWYVQTHLSCLNKDPSGEHRRSSSHTNLPDQIFSNFSRTDCTLKHYPLANEAKDILKNFNPIRYRYRLCGLCDKQPESILFLPWKMRFQPQTDYALLIIKRTVGPLFLEKRCFSASEWRQQTHFHIPRERPFLPLEWHGGAKELIPGNFTCWLIVGFSRFSREVNATCWDLLVQLYIHWLSWIKGASVPFPTGARDKLSGDWFGMDCLWTTTSSRLFQIQLPGKSQKIYNIEFEW